MKVFLHGFGRCDVEAVRRSMGSVLTVTSTMQDLDGCFGGVPSGMLPYTHMVVAMQHLAFASFYQKSVVGLDYPLIAYGLPVVSESWLEGHGMPKEMSCYDMTEETVSDCLALANSAYRCIGFDYVFAAAGSPSDEVFAANGLLSGGCSVTRVSGWGQVAEVLRLEVRRERF